MQTHSIELFPEILRVPDKNPQIYTSSRKVAVHFKQPHQQVVRCIQILIEDMNDTDMSGVHFQPVCAIDGKGKRSVEYRLTRDGFSFVAMRLNSQAALQWKVLFIQTYQQMRHAHLH